MPNADDIRTRLAAEARFTYAELYLLLKSANALSLDAALFDLLTKNARLIRPEFDPDDICGFMTRYLLRCIHENPGDGDPHIPTGYEAAHHLAACLKKWARSLPETEAILAQAVQSITAAYQAADPDEQDRLINGTLEHALESPALRPIFSHWQTDPTLHHPWQLAMEWALDHTDPA